MQPRGCFTSHADESNAWRAQLLPRVVAVRPPSWAVKAYKMVCLKDGVPVSVFDGTTEYRLGQTVMQRAADQHRGGLYVYRSLERCLARARKLFPKKSALLKGPRAVLRVRLARGRMCQRRGSSPYR